MLQGIRRDCAKNGIYHGLVVAKKQYRNRQREYRKKRKKRVPRRFERCGEKRGKHGKRLAAQREPHPKHASFFQAEREQKFSDRYFRGKQNFIKKQVFIQI